MAGVSRRTVPELVTLTVSSLVLALVIVLLVLQIAAGNDPARPVVTVGAIVERGEGGFHVPVSVRNRGDRAAASVQVTASLTTGATTVEADQVVDFLGVDETEELVFVFGSDPAAGELAVAVAGFADP